MISDSEVFYSEVALKSERRSANEESKERKKLFAVKKGLKAQLQQRKEN